MRWLIVMFVVATLFGCKREPAILLCNNANCAPPVDLRQDNTVEALRASLALQWQGRPAIDGIEIDTVWDASSSRCLFTLDYETAPGADEALTAATIIADYLREPSPKTSRFHVKINGKPLVAPDGRAHTAEEQIAHAECDLELAEVIEAGAAEGGRPLTILFGEDADALLAIMQRPRWTGKQRGTELERLFIVELVSTPPADLEVDIVAINWVHLHDGLFTALHDLEIELQVWVRQATVESLRTIDYIQPRYVDTNDLLAFREWLGPTPEDL